MPDAPDAGDIEGGISVRWTDLGHGSLIVHEDEVDELIAVLVVGIPPDHRIAGWLTVAEAKLAGRWRTDVRHPAFFVPQRQLRAIEELL